MGHTALGPATEARILAAFADRCILTAEATADLIGMDTDTLSELADEGVIRAVRRGKRRAYTEGDIRAYLTDSAPAERAARRKRETVPAAGKVLLFSERTAAGRITDRRMS